jgi:hypothetical protein
MQVCPHPLCLTRAVAKNPIPASGRNLFAAMAQAFSKNESFFHG